MIFSDAKVGDQILIYLRNGSKQVSTGKTSTMILATTLEQTDTGTILGWKSGEDYPSEDDTSLFQTSRKSAFSSNGFVHVLIYSNVCPCEQADIKEVQSLTVSKQASGCKCVRCLEWYEYAEPKENFVCYGCRH